MVNVAAAHIDPNVELLPDIPIAGPQEDLFDRARLAVRLVELAIAGPAMAPHVVALAGGAGAGKSSVLRMVTALVADEPTLSAIALDAMMHASTQAMMQALAAELGKLFAALGVVEAGDKVRDTLASYGGIVSSIAKLAGVKVDVAGALSRSADSLRAEIAENLERAGRRLVVVIDHLDRLPAAELAPALVALRMYAAIPYVSIVIAIDRHELATRPASLGGDPRAYERIVEVELALPPPDRLLLARVLGGGLARIAARTGRDLDAALPLLDPDGGLVLELIETPRDAKRAINALAAALPLAPATADVAEVALEIVLRVLVPELDSARLDARTRLADRRPLLDELTAAIAGHARAAAAAAALRELLRPA